MNHIDISAWGDEPPQFIQLLAKAVAETSRADVARRIKISRSTVSTLLINRYPSPSTQKIEAKIMAALGKVQCPTMGEIDSSKCQTTRLRPFMSTNAQAIAQFKACANCPLNPNRKGTHHDH